MLLPPILTLKNAGTLRGRARRHGDWKPTGVSREPSRLPTVLSGQTEAEDSGVTGNERGASQLCFGNHCIL